MKILNFLILLAAIVGGPAYSANSLSWQKLGLEDRIQQKIAQSLSPVLKANQYLAQAEIEISDPGGPNFGQSAAGGVRVSDISLADSRGDYIAFSKVGLEAPVLDKFFDEDKTRLTNLYRFNESYDIFKNITGIKVYVSFSDGLPEELIEIAKKIVNSTKLSIAGVKPQISFDTIKLEWEDPKLKEALAKEKREAAKKEEILRQEKNQEPKIWAKDWLEWASRWGNAFGLTLAALIMAGVAFMLFKQWKEFMALQQERESTASRDGKSDDQAQAGNEGPTPEETMELEKDFERFRGFLANHPVEATSMVREWIASEAPEHVRMLQTIAQQLTDQELSSLFVKMTPEQRDRWKQNLASRLAVKELMEMNKLISQEVLKSLLVPSRITDGELENLLLELKVDSSITFISDNPHCAGIIMNVLSPTFITKILTQVDGATCESYLEAGALYDFNSMSSDLTELKKKLSEFKRLSSPNPFSQRVMEMLPHASAGQETGLYRALIKAGGKKFLPEIARRRIPAELIDKLPVLFLKETLLSYPMSKRIEMLYCLEDTKREYLMSSFAPEGTPARDIVKMEIENIENDLARRATLKKSKEQVWDAFVSFARKSLERSPQYQGEIDEVVSSWLEQFDAPTNVVSLEKAA